MKGEMLKTNNAFSRLRKLNFCTKQREGLHLLDVVFNPSSVPTGNGFIRIIFPWNKWHMGLHFLHMDLIWRNLKCGRSTYIPGKAPTTFCTLAHEMHHSQLQNSVLPSVSHSLCPLFPCLPWPKVLRSLKTLPVPGKEAVLAGLLLVSKSHD